MNAKQELIIRMRVTHSSNQYLGECLEYPVMTHGKSLEELAENMRKALDLFMKEEGGRQEDEDSVIIRLNLGPGAGWTGDLA